jgi:hypothetical protein
VKNHVSFFLIIGALFICRILAAQDFDITDVRQVEDLRKAMNDTSSLSTKRSGDAFVFNSALKFVLASHDAETEIRFTRNWNDPAPDPGNPYWKDVRYLYKYFAGLNAEKLRKKGFLAAGDSICLNRYEDFSPSSAPAFASGIKFGAAQKIANEVFKKEVLKNDTVIGFLIEGTKLKLDFIFKGNDRIDFLELNHKYGTILVDFPLPMHTGSGKLIELGIQDGKVINYILSGGNHRSGVVIIDKKGNSFPFHIQRIQPSLWSGKYPPGLILDLVHNVKDLQQFLEIAQNDSLSMVMEMLLLDSTNKLMVRSIRDSDEFGGRRMLLWKTQDSYNPALLVLKDGFYTDILTKAAINLGFRWGIYCDVNFYDNAGYWENGQVRTQFSYENEIDESGKAKKPYHRMVLYK